MDYKQQSNQGCLAVNLVYLFGITPTVDKEKQILSDGLFRLRENFTLGCLLAFLDSHTDKSATVYVDNNYYLGHLKGWINHPRVDMVYTKNNQQLLDSLAKPFIVYLDNSIIDGWTHLPHFMMVVGSTDKFYSVFNPWDGKIIKISKSKLIKGIDLLRSHVRVCPIIISAYSTTSRINKVTDNINKD